MAGYGNMGRRGHGASRSLVLWGGAACLLLAPLVAMQFSAEVQWDGADFTVFGVMLAAACAAFELGARMTANSSYRAGVAVAIAAAFMLVWVNLAVGFLGSEDNPANLLFLGVIAVAAGGSALGRFRAAGMAWAMFAAAAAQLLVGGLAYLAELGSPGPAGLYEVTMGTSVFAALWLVAGGLFAKAAGDAESGGEPRGGADAIA